MVHGHVVKVSPEQLVELLWSGHIGGKHSSHLQQISMCSRSVIFFETGRKKKNNRRRASKRDVSFVFTTK